MSQFKPIKNGVLGVTGPSKEKKSPLPTAEELVSKDTPGNAYNATHNS